MPFLHIHKGDFLKLCRDSRDKVWGDIVMAPVMGPGQGWGDIRPHVGVKIRPGEENQGPPQFCFLEISYIMYMYLLFT